MGSFQFDFAISFAEEDSEPALELARTLSVLGARVYVYRHWQAQLVGKSLSKTFEKVFTEQSRFFVPIISSNYISKDWTRFEFDAALKERARRNYEYILPIRLDDSSLVGVSSDVGYIDLRKVSSDEASRILITKLHDQFPKRASRIVPTLWIATFGVTMETLAEEGDIPSGTRNNYARLCDELEADLMHMLRSKLEGVARSEASARNGDSLSVRVAFHWDPAKKPLDFGDLGFWEVLEVEPFENIYPGQTSKWLAQEQKKTNNSETDWPL